MVFVIRVRDPNGMHRLVFPNETSSWSELQQQVTDITKVPMAMQLLSRTPLTTPQYVEAPANATLKQLKLVNGDILYLGGHTPQTLAATKPGAASASSSSSSTSAASAASAPTHQLTPRCQHGPRGACPYCLGVEPGMENKVVGKCNHPPGATCIHCSQAIKEQSKEIATWLCSHPSTVFCPNCIPKESEYEKQHKQLSCSCDRSKGQECSRCLVTPPVMKVDKIPWQRFLDDKRAMCRFKHGDNVTCAMCVPPTLPSFKGKLNCDKGHRPWPEGVCLSCAPANATIKEQTYRHCDSVSIFANVLQPFYINWARAGSVFQRAAILFGRYVPEPAESNNPGAIRAVVHALYEPPQEVAKDFVRFLKDPHEKHIHSVSEKLGLEVVGWVLCTTERKGEKYGGAVFMSGLDVQQAARFQNRYKDQYGYSRFVTVIMEQSAQIEPHAYQVSDLGMCLERDGVFAKAEDSNMMCTRVPKQGEMVPTVVYKDRPLLPGKEFLPDEFIVKVIVTAPKSTSEWMFKAMEFPSLKENPTDVHLRDYMKKNMNKDYLTKFAEFNVIVYMTLKGTLPEKVLNEICSCIKTGKTNLSSESLAALDSLSVRNQWI